MSRSIVLASPHGTEYAFTDHTNSVEGLARPDIAVYRTAISRLPFDMARNQLVHHSLEMRRRMRLAIPPVEIEGIVWIDDDVVAPHDLIVRLLAHNLPLVSAFYISRKLPHTPQMYAAAKEFPGHYWPIMDWEDGKLMEVDACGFGAIWTSFEVIDAIAQQPEFDGWFKFEGMHGEDFFFCEQAKACGYKVMIDTSLECLHIAMVSVGLQTFKAIRPKLYLANPDGTPYQDKGEIAVQMEGGQ